MGHLREGYGRFCHTPPTQHPHALSAFYDPLFISLWTMFITYDIASAACS